MTENVKKKSQNIFINVHSIKSNKSTYWERKGELRDICIRNPSVTKGSFLNDATQRGGGGYHFCDISVVYFDQLLGTARTQNWSNYFF